MQTSFKHQFGIDLHLRNWLTVAFQISPTRQVAAITQFTHGKRRRLEMAHNKTRVLLGRIAGAHGIRGDLLVHTFTELPEAIGDYGELTDAEGRRPLKLKVQRVTPKGVIARAAGVADRTAAEKLKGAELWIERKQLPETEPGEFYHEDLVGLSAIDRAGEKFGEVVAVANYGAGDLLEIRLSGGRKTELVPFKEAFVPEVDLAGGRVVVAWPFEFEIVNEAPPEGQEET
jgi:16S rRNA processing protein RimM